MSMLYHPSKANIIADALSRKSLGSIAHVEIGKKELASEVHRLARLGVRLFGDAEGSIGVQSSSESSLVLEEKEKQDRDPTLVRLNESVKDQKVEVFSQGGDDVLRLQERLCVPDVDNLKQRIMAEAHGTRYSIHLGATKMYHDLREIYLWNGMKRNIVEFVVKCSTCQ